jgi:tripartite-type tricarboxylate transporter receptor subunit TctC
MAVIAALLFATPQGNGIAGDAAAGERYPARPVRFIIPFPPAGGTDIVGRLLAQRLSDTLRQPFVVDNRPGAASTIGANIAAKAAPDGYTVMLVTASYAMSASYYKSLPYDSVKDFVAVSLVASGPLLFVMHPSVAATSIKELVVLAKGAPGKLNYASGGAGGINHLAGELFNMTAGTRLVHVPYNGAGPALTGVISGEVQLMIATLGSSLPHVRSGKLKALAVGGDRRSTAAPELPTVAEAGLPTYSADNWYGLVVPRETPAAIVKILNGEISAALKTEDMRAQLVKLGFEAMSSTPTAFADYLKREIAKWARVMKTAGISESTTP